MPFDFKEWYAKNKERLAEARRARYASDPAYREKCQRLNREARDRKYEAEAKEKREEDKAKRAEPVSPWKQVEQNGKTYLTIGALARALGKSVKTLRLWESKGLLPKATTRSQRGDRLYSPELVIEIREKLLAEGKVDDSAPKERVFSSVHRVKMNGKVQEVSLFRVSIMAKAAGRSVATLLQLEEKGRFPKTPLRSQGSQRLYSIEMIEAARDAFVEFDKNHGRDWDAFSADLTARWNKLGMDNAEVLGEVKERS